MRALLLRKSILVLAGCLTGLLAAGAGAQTVTVFAEDFDAVAAPDLPAGWSSFSASGSTSWSTDAAGSSAPNAAFVPDINSVSDTRLTTPVFGVPGGLTTPQLSFANRYNLESSSTGAFDGGVLEISLNGGAWDDIIAAGGSFAQNGYTGVVSGSFSNPLAGRDSWTGDSGAFLTTVVDLPMSVLGQDVQLRWRLGTDSSVSRPGWWIDDVVVSAQALPVPEPSALTLAIVGLGLTGLLAYRRQVS